MSGSFWEYRQEQEALGNSNGLKPFGTKAYYAALQGVGAGIAYGTFNWAYYPDKFAFSHKNTVAAGPSRGMEYLTHTMLRPAVAFTAVGVTYAGVESFLEEVKGSHHKDPWNSAFAGAAAGMVLGGFFTRRFDIASMTALGVGLVMGMVEVNGPNVLCDPVAQEAKKFPSSFSAKFKESDDLSDLKAKYPSYKNN
mmetsp:Transcript_18934/g.46897  ORF Transcript_18934/g.46897 Transcript_18934/m.46897 type:complete len:195 (+) Transcript_18934:37-621(+)